MKEDDWCPASGLFEIEADIVVGDGVRHFEFPSFEAEPENRS
jgi:hypothetical protein